MPVLSDIVLADSLMCGCVTARNSGFSRFKFGETACQASVGTEDSAGLIQEFL